jgi:hypothetical protein
MICMHADTQERIPMTALGVPGRAPGMVLPPDQDPLASIWFYDGMTRP